MVLLARPLAVALRPKHVWRTFPSTMAAYAKEAVSSFKTGVEDGWDDGIVDCGWDSLALFGFGSFDNCDLFLDCCC